MIYMMLQFLLWVLIFKWMKKVWLILFIKKFLKKNKFQRIILKIIIKASYLMVTIEK